MCLLSNIFILALWISVLVLLADPPRRVSAKSTNFVIDDINDIKDFKKLLRTKTNVLVCFVSSVKESAALVKVVKEVGATIKGHGTMVLIDCSSEARKLCKKLKVNPSPAILKHYKNGEFHKDYDRKETTSAMLNFMRDPTGDIPWEEEDVNKDVLHIPDSQALVRYLRKQQLPTLVMFYAPWCGFCKQLKPEFAAAAAALKGQAVLAAIDVNQPQNAFARSQYNITGFPTLLYFENGAYKYTYEGENKKEGLMEFMKNPGAAPIKPKEDAWSDAATEIAHLTDDDFSKVLNNSEQAIVMFYAPWCGHCKKMKPEYEKAAEILKSTKNGFVLAALDATKETDTAKQWAIKGYPTLKYFKGGAYQFDVSVRTADDILKFVRDPKEPPPPPPPEKPWMELNSDVIHLGVDDFKPTLRKKKHALVMFYAPWCGHCKKAKPQFTLAAHELSEDPRVALAAVDCTVHSSVCSAYNVSGYPTIKLFNYLNKAEPVDYNGGRTAYDFLYFMAPYTSLQLSGVVAGTKSKKTEEATWGEGVIAHYSGGDFESFLKSQGSILVLFYAPWCGHCQHLKIAYVEAAQTLKSNKVDCQLAAVDIAAHPDIADRFSVIGLPTMKYFYGSKFIVDYKGSRDSKGIVEFMKNPPTRPVTVERDEL